MAEPAATAANESEAAALARALASSLAEQRRALAAAEADQDASELVAELRAALQEAEEALAELQREAEGQDEGRRKRRPRDDDNDHNHTAIARGPYRPAPTDFGVLAEAHPPLRPFLLERRPKRQRWRRDDDGSSSTPPQAPTLDFTDWRATRELTGALLALEYGVRGWSLPEGRLVPPVPNREAYLCWIADLLALVPMPPESSSPTPHLRGLDLGCGASLIYCLLGAAGWGWIMRGVDIDGTALEFAAKNAHAAAEAAPRLMPLLELARAAPTDLAPVAAALESAQPAMTRWSDLPGAGDGVLARALRAEAWEWRREGQQEGAADAAADASTSSSSFAFCVCNPPFFESESEAGGNPRTACGGTAQEMVCPGGEAAFVASMVADSAALALEGERWGREGDGGAPPPPSIHWYSTMVGKKSTLKAMRAALHELMRAPLPDESPRARVTAVRTTALAPQQLSGREGKAMAAATAAATTRWCIAWTFSPSARGTELRPLPPRGEEVVSGGAWLLRDD
jgi:23S rRNA A1618 N6-methylase RlmF